MGSSQTNVLTEWLSAHYPEVAPLDFYRDLFPEGSIAAGPDGVGYSPILVRILRSPDGTERAERHRVYGDLSGLASAVALDSVVPGAFDLISPVSYAGGRPLLRMAHELFALVFDLDGLHMEQDGTPQGIVDLFYQMERHPDVFVPEGRPPSWLPRPTFVASSGTGLHLYYLLDEPIRMWPDVCERLRLFRNSFTRLCWNKYVTDLSKCVQLEGVVQGFRTVGSLAKDGVQVVRAFRTGGRVSMDEMNLYVPPEARLERPQGTSGRSLEEARHIWPEWDPEWRRKALIAPKNPWRVKRALFDWWCRRVEGPEPSEGHRYWCIFVAACLAAKCPDVTYEELSSWAHGVRDHLDIVTSTPENAFTAEDVEAALAAYGNPVSVKLRRDKIADMTAMPMPVNRRNHREQKVHMATMRAIQGVIDQDGSWRNKDGAPKKRDLVRRYAIDHPGLSHAGIARALGLSRTTVVKWLKEGWRSEMVSGPRGVPGALVSSPGRVIRGGASVRTSPSAPVEFVNANPNPVVVRGSMYGSGEVCLRLEADGEGRAEGLPGDLPYGAYDAVSEGRAERFQIREEGAMVGVDLRGVRYDVPDVCHTPTGCR